ncbi:hypothetical protein MMC17_006293 [Xylographa soralifera]|nr:hypothetical protein [Xylographa soralifera]
MAAMRPTKSLYLLGFTPFFLGSACRVSSPLVHRDAQQQCFPYSSSASSETFGFRIAASFSAKGHKFNPKTDLFSFKQDDQRQAEIADASPRKRPDSGQDAFFVSNIGNSRNVAFGVADGVGGWSDSGIDSADFSHGLCERMADIAGKASTRSTWELIKKGDFKARDLLQKAYNAIVEEKKIRGGGSTACIAVGHSNGVLQVANLGDSGFVQLRPNAVYFASKPQTHAFNTPYQLSIMPPRMLARSVAFGHKPLSDQPKDASVTDHTVKHGDVLVFATDGVWDNLSSTDVMKLVSRYMVGFNGWANGKDGIAASDQLDVLTTEGGIAKERENTLQALLAVAITGEAKAASENTKLDGPFAREVQKYYPGEDWHGGKVDDICVVVAVVVKDDSEV